MFFIPKTIHPTINPYIHPSIHPPKKNNGIFSFYIFLDDRLIRSKNPFRHAQIFFYCHFCVSYFTIAITDAKCKAKKYVYSLNLGKNIFQKWFLAPFIFLILNIIFFHQSTNISSIFEKSYLKIWKGRGIPNWCRMNFNFYPCLRSSAKQI